VDAIHATIVAFATAVTILVLGFAAMGVATLFH
jgi:hypothetical protein